MSDALLSDFKNVVDNNKLKRSDEKRRALNFLSATVNGENVRKTKCSIKLSIKLGIFYQGNVSRYLF